MDDVSLDRSIAVLQLLATLGLTLVIGIEREERVARDRVLVGGVRTIPIIGLLGHSLALLSPGAPMPVALGFLGIAGLLAVEYHRRIEHQPHGATSEMAVLMAYLVGALVASHRLVVATAMTVATVLLLTSKDPLERLALRIRPREITTFVTFLVVAAVMLPVLPDANYTRFALNPRKTWMVVVAVSGLSYASYVVQQVAHARESVLLTALLGGAYSSTATTIVLARRSREHRASAAYAGGILLASSVMYVRLALLIAVFAPALATTLLVRLLALALIGGLAGALLLRLRRGTAGDAPSATEPALRHPLELGSAGVFALLFLVLTVATRWVATGFGESGVRIIAAVVGLTDVDPFVLGVANASDAVIPLETAASAVLVAAASNNVAKAIYSVAFSERRTGLTSLAGLLALAGITLGMAL